MGRTTSAGLVLVRGHADRVEVLLGHMGGPFWSRRERAWTVPKGEPLDGEPLLAAALREFGEETGSPPPPGPDVPLGEVRQAGGRTVVAWARRGDLDVTTTVSNTVRITWPPGSGRTIEVPEVDRFAWWSVPEGREVVAAAQAGLLDRVAEHVARGAL